MSYVVKGGSFQKFSGASLMPWSPRSRLRHRFLFRLSCLRPLCSLWHCLEGALTSLQQRLAEAEV